MISSINPLTVAFCISGVLRTWEGCSLEGGTIMEFRGGVRMVSVPAGAIAGVNAASDALIGVQSNLFFDTHLSAPVLKHPIFLAYEACYINTFNIQSSTHIRNFRVG